MFSTRPRNKLYKWSCTCTITTQTNSTLYHTHYSKQFITWINQVDNNLVHLCHNQNNNYASITCTIINTPTPSHTPSLMITIIINTPLFNTNQYHSIIEVGVLSNCTTKTTHYYNKQINTAPSHLTSIIHLSIKFYAHYLLSLIYSIY